MIREVKFGIITEREVLPRQGGMSFTVTSHEATFECYASIEAFVECEAGIHEVHFLKDKPFRRYPAVGTKIAFYPESCRAWEKRQRDMENPNSLQELPILDQWLGKKVKVTKYTLTALWDVACDEFNARPPASPKQVEVDKYRIFREQEDGSLEFIFQGTLEKLNSLGNEYWDIDLLVYELDQVTKTWIKCPQDPRLPFLMSLPE